MNRLTRILFALTLAFGLAANASALDYENMTPEQYLKVFQTGSLGDKQKASESLAWAGISSPKLFDAVEKSIDENLAATKGNKVVANAVAWMVKALSYSGNEKYIPKLQLLAKRAPHGTVKKYAKISLDVLPKYTVWNPLIAPKAWPEAKHPSLDQRLKNMLASNNYELMRTATKRIYYPNRRDADLLAAVNQAIENNYSKQTKDKLFVDSLAWLCKTIANARSEEYRPTLEKVARSAPNKKLRGYVKKYLKQYYI